VERVAGVSLPKLLQIFYKVFGEIFPKGTNVQGDVETRYGPGLCKSAIHPGLHFVQAFYSDCDTGTLQVSA